MNYLYFINNLPIEVFEKEHFKVKDYNNGYESDFDRTDIDNELNKFYKKFDGLLFKWEAIDDNPDNFGSINILKTKDAFADGKDLVFFDHTPDDSPLRDFYIIDFFVDEACVGVYGNHPELPGMHYFEFENETYPLYVDFEGYMKLLGETKGFLYWQKAILDHLAHSESFETKNFKEVMPRLFPDFSYEKFIELYESVRIDR